MKVALVLGAASGSAWMLGQATPPPVSEMLEYGALAGVVAAMFWMIRRLLEDHRNERTEWRTSSEQQFDKLSDADERRTERITAAFEKLSESIQNRPN